MSPKHLFLALVLSVFAPLAFAAPTVSTLAPANGAAVSTFASLSVTFSEAVTGMDSNDLSVNGEAPVSVTGSGAGPYVFTFTQPAAGTVSVNWEADHGITGIATGAFVAPGAYAYTLSDTIAPTIGVIATSQPSDGTLSAISPPPGTTVSFLGRTDVTFSEAVTGVDAADLLVAGNPATAVTGSGAGPYVFTFASQPTGAVNFSWAVGHGIVDGAGNAFAGAGWSVTVGSAGALRITEILAANGTGLADENGEQNGWIEIWNAGVGSVSLLGWSLTDDSDNPRKWVLPARTLAQGAYIVVFASGKDRKPASGNLHTNFKLGVSGGYLGLYQAVPGAQPLWPYPWNFIDGVTSYPPQRTDYSYANVIGGPGAYYHTPPTPGVANAASTLTALAANPTASVSRGFFKDPLTVVLSCATAGATVRYTLDGTVPTAASTAYTVPISVSNTTLLRAVAFATNFVPSETITHSYIYLDSAFAQASPPYDNPANGADNANPQPPSVGGVALPVHWGTASNFQNTAPATTGYVPFNNLPASNSVPADYGMDTKIVNDPNLYDDAGNISPSGKTNLQRMKESLRTLPILSVVMPSKDMFGPIADVPTALYPTSSAASKIDRTKACSLELLLPDASTAFATTCGIDIHGNASRDPFKNPKHGFTLKFKGDYGPGTLDYELFPDSPVRSFDKLVLRADFNSSWRHQDVSTPTQRPKETRVRDAWSKDTFRAMGRSAGHHRYTNLFINGVYWGTYDLAEDQAEDFAASYFGGDKADYDVFDQGVLKNGTATAYYAMKATLGWTDATSTTAPTAGVLATAFTNAEYETLKGQLDVPWLIDYMVQHYYIGHEDWGTTTDYNKNWYAVRNAKTGGKFRFLPWDQENILYSETINRVTGALYPPVAAQNRLRTNAQFALDFADQVHKHMVSPDGALLPAANIARFNKWGSIMNAGAMALESARWGDYRMNVHNFQFAPYNIVYTWNGKWFSGGSTQTSTVNWLTEVSRLNGTYFPARTANVLGQFRATPTAPALVLYPAVNAPEIRNNATDLAIASQRVAAGFVVKFANVTSLPGGTVNATTFYYTTNGTDPRVYYTGAIAGTAIAPNATLTINSTTTLKVRALNAGTWSALNEQTFTVGNDSLIPTVRITEIMYHKSAGWAAEEFIELRNFGTAPVDMSNWSFNGIECIIPIGTVLGPGDFFVLASNDAPTAWAATYPGVAVGAYFGGSLDNGGERISLHDATGRTITGVNYDDAWYPSTDGGGRSLEVIAPNGDPNDAANWQASALANGTPGAANSAPVTPQIIISEFLVKNSGAYTTGGFTPGYVELFNPGVAAVNIGGWVLHDYTTTFYFPTGTTIPAGGYTVVNFGAAGAPGFSSGAALVEEAGTITLSNSFVVIDSVRRGPQATNYAFGKIGGVWALSTPTPGAANVAATSAPQSNLRLNEWLAKPRYTHDWLELYNTHATLPVALGGLYVGTNDELFQMKSLSAIAPLSWARLFCQQGSKQPDTLDFDLPAAGTTLTLRDSGGAQFDSATFGAQAELVSQGRLPDGTGSIVTLGAPSPAIANHATITGGPQINEILVTNLNGDNAPWGARPGWIEFRNPTGSPLALGGWILRSYDGEIEWNIPAGTTIPSGGLLAIWTDDTRNSSTTASPHLNSNRQFYQRAELLNPARQVVDSIDFGNQIPDLSIGRIAGGSWALLATPTRGTTNSGAAALGSASALRVNEWSNSFVELFNTSALPISLSGLYLSDDPSELGRRKFAFTPLSFIAGNGFAVVPSYISGFNVSPLGEYLRLAQSDDSLLEAHSFGQFIASMGRTPDGSASIAPFADTQGLPNATGTGAIITIISTSRTVLAGSSLFFYFGGANTSTYQWNFNGTPIPGGSGAYTGNAYFSLPPVTSAHDGIYTCILTGPGGSATSQPIQLTVLHTFDTWTASHGIAGAATDGDADGDGIKNLAEFLANTNPVIAATAAERTAHQAVGTLELSAGVPTFQTLDFRLHRRAAFTGFGVDTSLDLGTWTAATPDLSELISTEPNGDQHWRLKFAVPGGTAKRFLRLNIAE